MYQEHTKVRVVSSLLWKLMEQGGTQGILFIVQVVLARLLLPEDFGTIAIVLVFISLARVFVNSGFNTALIQKKDVDRVDFSSVFYLSLLIAGLIYVLIYIFSPFLAEFYREPMVTPVLRVLSLVLFFGAFNSIQNAYIARNMLFKKLFYSSIGGIIVSGIVGIAAAYMGFGIWALVIQQLLNQILVTIIMWFTIEWRPSLEFSLSKVKTLFSFGWKLLASSLLNTLYVDLRTLVIGKLYTPSVLGYYNRGQQFPHAIVTNINGSIQSVMLPALSAQQDNKKRVKDMMRRAIMTSSFIIFPMMVGMAVVAEQLVKIILTDKWLPAVPFLQIFCIAYALTPIQTANLQAINAVGRSDIFLKLTVINKLIGLGILIVSLPFGVHAIAIGQVLSSIITSFINAHPNKLLLDYSYGEQWADIIPSFLIAAIMGIIVYVLKFLSLSTWLTLVTQIGIGIIVFIGFSKLFKVKSLEYMVTTMKQFFSANN